LGHYKQVLIALVEKVEQRVWEVRLLSATEEEQVLRQASGGMRSLVGGFKQRAQGLANAAVRPVWHFISPAGLLRFGVVCAIA